MSECSIYCVVLCVHYDFDMSFSEASFLALAAFFPSRLALTAW